MSWHLDQRSFRVPRPIRLPSGSKEFQNLTKGLEQRQSMISSLSTQLSHAMDRQGIMCTCCSSAQGQRVRVTMTRPFASPRWLPAVRYQHRSWVAGWLLQIGVKERRLSPRSVTQARQAWLLSFKACCLSSDTSELSQRSALLCRLTPRLSHQLVRSACAA